MDAIMRDWYESRPQVIKNLYDRVPPDKLYRLNNLGEDHYVVNSYNENGTIKATRFFANTNQPIHQVFGLSPDDFIPIDKEKEQELYSLMKKDAKEIHRYQ